MFFQVNKSRKFMNTQSMRYSRKRRQCRNLHLTFTYCLLSCYDYSELTNIDFILFYHIKVFTFRLLKKQIKQDKWMRIYDQTYRMRNLIEALSNVSSVTRFYLDFNLGPPDRIRYLHQCRLTKRKKNKTEIEKQS